MRHVLPLTSVRFVAALLVVLFHADGPWRQHLPVSIQNIVTAGYLGVPFFFVLSGYILAYNYVVIKKAVFGWSAFYRARVARIYPVYVMAFMLSCAVGVILGTLRLDFTSVHMSIMSLLLVQAWSPATALWLNGPAWSLSVEAFFYCAFPVIVKFTSARQRVGALLGTAFIGAAVLLLDRAINGGRLFHQIQNVWGFSFPLLWLPLFVLGISMAEMRADPFGKHSASRLSYLLLAVASAGMLLMSGCCRSSTLLFSYIAAVPFSAIIWSLEKERSWISQILSARPLVLLGEASYALYILHRPLYLMFSDVVKRSEWMGAHSSISVLLYVVICIGVSIVVLEWVEKPARTFLSRGSVRFSKAEESSPMVGVC